MYQNLVMTLLGTIAVYMHMWLPMLDIIERNVRTPFADDEHSHRVSG